jgi:release factor glutamine methyltransferase
MAAELTELATEIAAGPTASKLRILDLGTGSGCISILLAALLPPDTASIVAVDSLPDAVSLAQLNARRVKTNRISVRELDITSPDFAHNLKFEAPFDVIVSNPPYIPLDEWKELGRSVKDYESPRALVGGHDGLLFYRCIAKLMPKLLKPDGIVYVEIGEGQEDQVVEILGTGRKNSEIEIWDDQFGVKRTVVLS